jgi:hypothetical protein
MNEHIRQLAKEAGMIYGQGNLDDFDMLTYMPKEVRFAELIIRECLDQCYNRGMNDLQLLYAGQLKAAAYIKEHFGVEE